MNEYKKYWDGNTFVHEIVTPWYGSGKGPRDSIGNDMVQKIIDKRGSYRVICKGEILLELPWDKLEESIVQIDRDDFYGKNGAYRRCYFSIKAPTPPSPKKKEKGFFEND